MERACEISASMAMSALCGAKSIYLLTKIVGAEFDSQALQSETGLTRKALYIRLSRLQRAGIITRRNGKYSLTSFGKIVYHAQDLIAIALDNYWRLSALDSLGMLRELPTTEYDKICEKLLNDQQIKKALSQNAVQTEINQSAVCMNQIFIKTQRSKNHKGEFVEA
jgi:DNA-binding HxlR family transcriptional regulator